MAAAVRARIRPRTFHRADALLLMGVAVSSLALVWTIYYRLSPFTGAPGFILLWFAAFVTLYWLSVRELEGPLEAKNRAVTAVIAGIAVAIIFPLAIILAYTTWRGVKALHVGFFFQDLSSVSPQEPATAGGALHAIVGTLEEVGLAAVISVPLGVMTAVFLNEVGGSLRRPVRMFVDAMSGVPSIVAGLFVYVVFIAGLGIQFSGFMAALALSILMLPTVTRTTEVVLRLVPNGLREASLALGAPEWRTVLNVVLPTARTGIVTAVILGVARVIGETAPLIMTSFGSSVMNSNPFHAPQSSLPLFVWGLITQPVGAAVDRAWTGAFALILLVLVVFVLARVIGRNRASLGRVRVAAVVEPGEE
jgi:phosphate transport system permease protein